MFSLVYSFIHHENLLYCIVSPVVVSAAFDTVDHKILLERFISFGFSGTLLLWLRFFLSEHSFCVVHGPSLMVFPGLCPLLFIIYISDLASLLSSHAVLAQLYADDVQAYQHCLSSGTVATVWAMSIAMGALGTWMLSNRSASTP